MAAVVFVIAICSDGVRTGCSLITDQCAGGKPGMVQMGQTMCCMSAIYQILNTLSYAYFGPLLAANFSAD